jgi:hypothetical protein
MPNQHDRMLGHISALHGMPVPDSLPLLSELFQEAMDATVENDRPDLLEKLLDSVDSLTMPRIKDPRPGFHNK